MDPKDAKKIADSISALQHSVDDLNRTHKDVSKSISRSLHPAQQIVTVATQEVMANVPVYLDWMDSPIVGRAVILKNEDGTVRIDVRVNGAEAFLIEALVEQMNVEALRLSVVEI